MVSKSVVRIRYSEIPKYLHGSAFYNALSSDEHDGVVEVPADCYLATDTIQSRNDFECLLRAVMFWGVDELPVGLYLLCSSTPSYEWETIARSILGLEAFYALTKHCKNYRSLAAAVRTGLPEVVDNWISLNPPASKNARDAILQAVSAGDLSVIKRLHAQGYPWHPQTALVAAYSGRIDCLKYVHQNGCLWDEHTLTWAAKGGSVECLQYAYENNCPWNVEVVRIVFREGHVDCLVYLLDAGCPWDGNVRLDLTHMECVRCVLEKGLALFPQVYTEAITQNYFDVLILLHEYNVPWDSSVTKVAASMRRVDMLRYLLHNGCPACSADYETPVDASNLACIQLLHDYHVPWCEDPCLPFFAAVTGDIDILRYLMDRGCPYESGVWLCGCAANCVKSQGLACLRYLIEDIGVEVGTDAFSIALARGNLEMVAYLVDIGCPCAYTHSSINGTDIKNFNDTAILQCIEYAADHGWTYGEDDNLSCLVQYKHLHLCEEYLEQQGWYKPFIPRPKVEYGPVPDLDEPDLSGDEDQESVARYY